MTPNFDRFSRAMPWEYEPSIDDSEYDPSEAFRDADLTTSALAGQSRDLMSQENSKPQTQQNKDTKTTNP